MGNGVPSVDVPVAVGVTRQIMIASGPKRRRFSDSFASSSSLAFADDRTSKREVCPENPLLISVLLSLSLPLANDRSRIQSSWKEYPPTGRPNEVYAEARTIARKHAAHYRALAIPRSRLSR